MLAKCPLRTRARITAVDVEKQFDLRLQELGVRAGAEFSVVNRAAFGGLVINIAGARIAVDHKSAKRIMVEDALTSQSELAQSTTTDAIEGRGRADVSRIFSALARSTKGDVR